VIDWQKPGMLNALNTHVVTEIDKLQASMYRAHVEEDNVLSGYSISTSFFGTESPFFMQREAARQELANQVRAEDKQSAFLAASGVSESVDDKDNDTAAFWAGQIMKEKTALFEEAVINQRRGDAIGKFVF